MITIHMTTYRRHRSGLLRRALESVLSQDFPDFELVLCDDASTDGTAAYLDWIAASDPRVRIIRNPRNVNSVAVSLGRCLLQADASRPWVSWMFDDCVLLPGALGRLVAALRAHPEMRMLYGVTEVTRPDSPPQRVGAPEAEVRACIAGNSALVPNAGILVHRDVFTRHGWYDPSIALRRSCDWDLFRRFVQGGVPFLVLPEVLAREDGWLQADSLRNAYTARLDHLIRFAAARDASGIRLDLANALTRPVDWIPPAAWSAEDLDLMRYQCLEYFLSIGEVARAFHWARQLVGRLDQRGLLLRDNLLHEASTANCPERRALAAGAFAGTVLGAWRVQQMLQ
jgi:glycosyltransferase involved in cell wall biosynthesis